MDDHIYPGQEEVQKYVDRVDEPSFHDFMSMHSNNLPGWSIGAAITSSRLLFNVWKRRFLEEVNDQAKLPPAAPIVYHSTVWQPLYREMKLLREAQHAYRTAGFELLIKASRVCRDTVARTLEASGTSEHSQDNEHNTDVKGKEEEYNSDDEDDADKEIQIDDDGNICICGNSEGSQAGQKRSLPTTCDEAALIVKKNKGALY